MENRRSLSFFLFFSSWPGSDYCNASHSQTVEIIKMFHILKVGTLLRIEIFLFFLCFSSWPGLHYCKASHSQSWKNVKNRRFFVVFIC